VTVSGLVLSNAYDATSAGQAKELAGLWRAGKLYQSRDGLRQANRWTSLPRSSGDGRPTLLQVAVETGFQSLVELIATHDTSLASKDAALADATSARRLDLVEVLLAHGSNIESVPLKLFRAPPPRCILAPRRYWSICWKSEQSK